MNDEFSISNLEDFIQHMKDSYHIPKQDTQDNVQSLLIESALENKRNYPRKRTTCFLRPTIPHGKDYWPYKKCELLNAVKDTVRFGNNVRTGKDISKPRIASIAALGYIVPSKMGEMKVADLRLKICTA